MLSSMVLAGTVQVPLSKYVADIHVRIQFVQDVSGSMDGTKLVSSQEGLRRICRKLSQGDEVGLIKFGDFAEVVRYVFHTFSNSSPILWLLVSRLTSLL
ncbi:hypothetical protein BC938DRAFT_477812 [Jimgerdemannia flammicorona]|uniref:VWFA domain-containing protein n=1 Tax=Jimgerdemannia flammicorona TaxID=994334 RepID=A0A433QYR6_9FUNG|nr:hypothetical protein BC938DRAFT_477812 [Jimgerdemannia flammicorona]